MATLVRGRTDSDNIVPSFSEIPGLPVTKNEPYPNPFNPYDRLDYNNKTQVPSSVDIFSISEPVRVPQRSVSTRRALPLPPTSEMAALSSNYSKLNRSQSEDLYKEESGLVPSPPPVAAPRGKTLPRNLDYSYVDTSNQPFLVANKTGDVDLGEVRRSPRTSPRTSPSAKKKLSDSDYSTLNPTTSPVSGVTRDHRNTLQFLEDPLVPHPAHANQDPPLYSNTTEKYDRVSLQGSAQQHGRRNAPSSPSPPTGLFPVPEQDTYSCLNAFPGQEFSRVPVHGYSPTHQPMNPYDTIKRDTDYDYADSKINVQVPISNPASRGFNVGSNTQSYSKIDARDDTYSKINAWDDTYSKIDARDDTYSKINAQEDTGTNSTVGNTEELFDSDGSVEFNLEKISERYEVSPQFKRKADFKTTPPNKTTPTGNYSHTSHLPLKFHPTTPTIPQFDDGTYSKLNSVLSPVISPQLEQNPFLSGKTESSSSPEDNSAQFPPIPPRRTAPATTNEQRQLGKSGYENIGSNPPPIAPKPKPRTIM